MVSKCAVFPLGTSKVWIPARMAAAARNYLAIPASEVLVERLFSAGIYVLGVQSLSIKGYVEDIDFVDDILL